MPVIVITVPMVLGLVLTALLKLPLSASGTPDSLANLFKTVLLNTVG